MAIQGIRSKARNTVHKAFSVSCTYLPASNPESPLTIPVRKYEKNHVDIGQFNGDSSGWAEIAEDFIYVVIDLDDVTPELGDVISHPDGEYEINRVLPPKGKYSACVVLPK